MASPSATIATATERQTCTASSLLTRILRSWAERSSTPQRRSITMLRTGAGVHSDVTHSCATFPELSRIYCRGTAGSGWGCEMQNDKSSHGTLVSRAMSSLLLVAVCTSDAAMERSQRRERGTKPPAPIGTNTVHPRKPLDQPRRRHCATSRSSGTAINPASRHRRCLGGFYRSTNRRWILSFGTAPHPRPIAAHVDRTQP